jgi:hypothetical protein
MVNRRPKQRRNLLGHVLMQPSNHVAVGVQCDADVGVPEASCTTFGWTPACKARVAQPCRRSSNLIGGSPSRCTASEKPRVNRSGCNIVPSTWQKTRSRSVHPAPISSRSAACRLRCSCNAATVPASRVTVRRPFKVKVGPAQTQRFASPQSGCGEHEVRGPRPTRTGFPRGRCATGLRSR